MNYKVEESEQKIYSKSTSLNLNCAGKNIFNISFKKLFFFPPLY